MSKIIFLNGCGSSGKTSIAKAIQHENPDLWLSFGIDTFIDMIPFGRQEPYLKFIPGQNERGSIMNIQSGPEAKKLFGLMPRFAEMLAANGNNVIIDEVLFNLEYLKEYARHLANYKVYYVGIFCDLKIMQEREVLRGDRCIGLSNSQIDIVHEGGLNSYDFRVDTSAISPVEAARQICNFMDNNPSPQAFKLLNKLDIRKSS